MRCFVAIAPSDDVRLKIGAFAAECAEAFPGRVKPVSVPNLHLTLSFLGETDPERFGGIIEKLSSLFCRRFELEARGTGFFPEEGPPRVLWAGTASSVELLELNSMIEKAVAELGFPRTSPGFVPHFTVGRVKGGGDPELAAFLADRSEAVFGRFAVDRVTLFRSDLSGGEPLYSTIREFVFK